MNIDYTPVFSNEIHSKKDFPINISQLEVMNVSCRADLKLSFSDSMDASIATIRENASVVYGVVLYLALHRQSSMQVIRHD